MRVRWFFWLLSFAATAIAGSIPHLQKHGTATELIVDGKPMILLAGELHNSSSSSLEYLAPIWSRLEFLNLNAAIASVSWELLEPEEGHFDYSLVDGLLRQAREHHMKLVLIWFGTWKNGVSSYAPVWVKRDLQRFPRAQSRAGRNTEVITPFSENARNADGRAFRALLRHLREMDSQEQTVVMMQVENEVGLKNNARDVSPAADAAFGQAVPAELLRAKGLHTTGSWSEVFGANEVGEEAFMAWHYARYLGYVAGQGKAEYPIPMYANAWLQGDMPNGDKQKPGIYPSGGPVSHVLDIWKAGAPEIDLLAPDIYLPDFKGITAEYTRAGNALFIPEAKLGPDIAGRAFYAIAQHDAIGFAPFGIDELELGNQLMAGYELLGALAPEILRHHGDGTMVGILEEKEDQVIRLGGYALHVSCKVREKKGTGYGLVIATGPGEYLMAGSNFTVTFEAEDKVKIFASIAEVDEMVPREGKLVAERRLNGDETAGGWQVKMPVDVPGVQRVRVYRHE